jgi:hypothetical protein
LQNQAHLWWWTMVYKWKLFRWWKPAARRIDDAVYAGKRLLVGEIIDDALISARKKHVSFASPYPGKIIALSLQQLEKNYLLEGCFLRGQRSKLNWISTQAWHRFICEGFLEKLRWWHGDDVEGMYLRKYWHKVSFKNW